MDDAYPLDSGSEATGRMESAAVRMSYVLVEHACARKGRPPLLSFDRRHVCGCTRRSDCIWRFKVSNHVRRSEVKTCIRPEYGHGHGDTCLADPARGMSRLSRSDMEYQGRGSREDVVSTSWQGRNRAFGKHHRPKGGKRGINTTTSKG